MVHLASIKTSQRCGWQGIFEHCPMVNVVFRSLYNISLVIVKGGMRKMLSKVQFS